MFSNFVGRRVGSDELRNIAKMKELLTLSSRTAAGACSSRSGSSGRRSCSSSSGCEGGAVMSTMASTLNRNNLRTSSLSSSSPHSSSSRSNRRRFISASARRLRINVDVTSSKAGERKDDELMFPHNEELLQTLLKKVEALCENDHVKGGSNDNPTHCNHKNLVAFSGGVDSSLVAALLYKVSPANTTAVIGISPALPQAQLYLAREVAKSIGIPLKEVTTDEGSVAGYIANEGAACFHCKTALYNTLNAIADDAKKNYNGSGGALLADDDDDDDDDESSEDEKQTKKQTTTTTTIALFNGTNGDDRTDLTRVGLIAAANFQVRSPLADITKNEVRTVAKMLSLPNWNHAASPCLRSRLAFGVEATSEHLERIEKAEIYVRDILNLDATRDMRVRMLSGGKGMIELDEGVYASFSAAASERQDQQEEEESKKIIKIRDILDGAGVQEKFLQLGFKSFDFRRFKSGAEAKVSTAAL